MNNRFGLIWILFGLVLGGLASVSPGYAFMAMLSAVVAAALYRFSSLPNRRFLLLLFLSALALRAGVSAGLDLLSWKAEGELPYQDGPVQNWNLHISDKTRGYLKIGDSDYFSQRGYATAQFVEGSNEPVLPFRINQYGKHGYILCIGWFYHLFGFSPCAVKLINCVLGALTAVLVFLLGQCCFSPRPARWAGILTAFFPSLILWSATNLKDIPLTFFTLLILFLYSRWTQTIGAKSRLALFLLLLGALRIHMTFRSIELSFILAGTLLAAHLLPRFLRSRPAAALAALSILLLAGVALSFLEPVGYRIRQALMQPFNWHIGFTTTPGSSYTFLPTQFYQEGYRWEWVETGRMNLAILVGMGQAVLHYLFEPFPWKMSNTFQWFSYPQMIVWYALFPFAVVGILQGLRKRRKNTLALILTTIIFTGIGSLANGNTGTVFRLRDMVTPLFLILGCAGLHRMLPPSVLQGSVILKFLSRRSGRLRTSLQNTAGRISESFRNGPAGSSWRAQPLRSIGILGLAVLSTLWLLIPILGKTLTGWERMAGAVFGVLSLLALFHRGNWRQVIEGSRALRFLQRT